MPTSDAPTVATAPIRLNLTAAGWVVVAMMVASVFIASTSRVALGFMIPLAAALVIDVYMSWFFLNQQAISITPSRTIAYGTDPLPMRVTCSTGARPVRVTLALPDGEELALGLTADPESIDVLQTRSGAVDYLRASIYCTVLGLSSAERWQTHAIPMLHWSPEPDAERVPTPDAIDDVARLRAYVPGDRMSRVSWPVTARTGEMHVRAAGVGHEEITLIVNLGEGSETEAEHARALAATLGAQLVEDGHTVRMVTTELDPEYRGRLRRAAMDNPRTGPVADDGAPELTVVDAFLVDEDDLARRLARAEPGPILTWPFNGAVDISPAGITSTS